MASKLSHPTYEDFEPPVELSEEDGCTILTLYIPGFSKEQIQVKVSSRRKLKISGERAYNNSKSTRQRFHKEFEIASNCDTANITAKYKDGILYVRQPLLQDESEPHTPNDQTPKQQADNPILEETNQTNSTTNHDAPVTNTPKINNKLWRLKEMIPGVFLKLGFSILLPLILLLFWINGPAISNRGSMVHDL